MDSTGKEETVVAMLGMFIRMKLVSGHRETSTNIIDRAGSQPEPGAGSACAISRRLHASDIPAAPRTQRKCLIAVELDTLPTSKEEIAVMSRLKMRIKVETEEATRSRE